MQNKFSKNEMVYVEKYKTNGTIIDSNRYFKEVDVVTNRFKNDGHAVIESTLNDFTTSYKLVNDTLIVNMPEGFYGTDDGLCEPFEIKYKAKDIVYTVDIPNHGSVVFFQKELSSIV